MFMLLAITAIAQHHTPLFQAKNNFNCFAIYLKDFCWCEYSKFRGHGSNSFA